MTTQHYNLSDLQVVLTGLKKNALSTVNAFVVTRLHNGTLSSPLPVSSFTVETGEAFYLFATIF